MAEVFEKLENWKLALHYHQKSLDVCVALDDWESAGKANESIGICHQKLGDMNSATQAFEEFLTIATQSHDRREQTSACIHLIEIYQSYANELEVMSVTRHV